MFLLAPALWASLVRVTVLPGKQRCCSRRWGCLSPTAMMWSELAVCYWGLGDEEGIMDLLSRAGKEKVRGGSDSQRQVVLAHIRHTCTYSAAPDFRRSRTISERSPSPSRAKSRALSQ